LPRRNILLLQHPFKDKIDVAEFSHDNNGIDIKDIMFFVSPQTALTAA